MCYYDHYRYSCGDWKWGNFRQHCQKEYRTGETCGMKLLNTTIHVDQICPACEKIERKKRRLVKACADVERWRQEPGRFAASIEKAVEEGRELHREIVLLQEEKDRRYANVGNTRRTGYA